VADATPEGKRGAPPRAIREKDLEKHLQGEEEKGPSEKTPAPTPEKIQDLSKKPAAQSSAEVKEDPPLDRALELLKTWRILNKLEPAKAS